MYRKIFKNIENFEKCAHKFSKKKKILKNKLTRLSKKVKYRKKMLANFPNN